MATIEEIRDLFAYDRWATERLLGAVDGIDETTWTAAQVIDERGLGGILVHMLGAYQRWRHGLAGDDERPRPEQEPLLGPVELRARWATELEAMEAWLATLDDAWLARDDEGVPFAGMLRHLVNHGTQHRSEAAALLTQASHSPGDLDMINWLEDRAGWVDGVPPSQQPAVDGAARPTSEG
jgi:uncharacterized damage-inducible protein DinB